MENELGVLLLQRTSRVVSLTKAGEVFADAARDVLARFDLAVAEARRAGGANPALRIGCVPYLPIQELLLFLRALQEHDPSQPTQVSHLLAVEQLRHLRDGQLDLGIFYHAEDYDDLELEPLVAGEPLVAYLPLDHPLAGRKVLGPGDLSDEDLVIFPRTANPALYELLLSMLEDSGYKFSNIREGNGDDWRDLLVAVAGGLGVAILPSSLKDVSEAGTIVTRSSLEPQLTMPDTVVAWRINLPRQLQETLAAVRQLARELRQS